MKTRTNILTAAFGLVVLWFLGSVALRAWNEHEAGCSSCAIDINALASDSMTMSPQKWSVQYLVDRDVTPKHYCCDQSTATANSLEAEPDDNRGLAFVPVRMGSRPIGSVGISGRLLLSAAGDCALGRRCLGAGLPRWLSRRWWRSRWARGRRTSRTR